MQIRVWQETAADAKGSGPEVICRDQVLTAEWDGPSGEHSLFGQQDKGLVRWAGIKELMAEISLERQ